MGSITNYATLFICIVFGFLMVAPASKLTNNNVIANVQTFTNTVSNNSIENNVNIPVFVGTISFPNPFTLFNNFAKMFASLVTLPFDVLGSLTVLPDTVRIFLIAIFTLILALAAVSWFKGQESI
jgi:hypothetical protein